MSSSESLFSNVLSRQQLPTALGTPGTSILETDLVGRSYAPVVDDRLLDLFSRAVNPTDPFELRDLWLGRVECEARCGAMRLPAASLWRGSRRQRSTNPEEILSSQVTVRFIKELFNSYFRDDLYGRLRGEAKFILSSGAVDERCFGLSEPLKETIRFALRRDWYGYSDSRGREPCREAIAEYENAKLGNISYGSGNVALTMGGTFAVNAIADFYFRGRSDGSSPALCAIPNYPPLVEAVSRRAPVKLVSLSCGDGAVSLRPLINALRPDTPFVLLQTVGNPTGGVVSERELAELVAKASSGTLIVLDECHECLGPLEPLSPLRAASNVVRVSSLSKSWSAPGLKVGWILADKGFIDEYYEYASTTYGGPPSIFYTLIEVVARMERWHLSRIEEPTGAQLSEFEPHYGLTTKRLADAYRIYRGDRVWREQVLRQLRTSAVSRLGAAGLEVVVPRCSINAAVVLSDWDDSYVCFRDMLHETGVSLLPGVLTFCFSEAVMRVTAGRPWNELSESLEAVAARPSHTLRLASVAALHP